MRIKKPLKNTEGIKKVGIYCWSIIGLLVLVSLGFYLLYRIRIAIFPLIVATGIAYLLTPLVSWLSRKMKKPIAKTMMIAMMALANKIFFTDLSAIIRADIRFPLFQLFFTQTSLPRSRDV